MECGKETEYALRKTPITKTIRDKEYHFSITTAYCKECGCEVGVRGILDQNAKEIDDQFRKTEGIISIDEIEKLGKIYGLGKAPLSIALGFGEITITRYLAGQIPSKEYSNVMKKALSDTKVMRELVESNKDKLADAAYRKVISAINELDAIFSVPSKMLVVISYIFEALEEVTPLALQKLLYFIQGLYSSKYDTPLFDDNCQAWVQVIDLVVNTFGLYGGKVLESITHEENPWNDAREGYSDNEPSQEEISQEAIKNYFVGVRKKYDLDTEAGIMNYIRNMLT